MAITRVIFALLLGLSSSISQLFVSAGAAENNFDPAVDYYRVLGVDERASAADIKHSYKNLARKYHPDVSSEPDATSHFAEINEAYEVLGNERTRSDYDAVRAFGKPQYAQFGDAYREGRGGAGRPKRYTYVYRYQSPDEYYEFDPRDLYDFYASNERGRRSGNYYRNSDFHHAGNHNALKFYDVVKSKLLDLLTPMCILFIELLCIASLTLSVMEESLASLKNELNLLKERYVFGESVDPVFEGTVRQFLQFDNTLQEIYRSVDVYIRSIENLCAGIMQLSESMVNGMGKMEDPLIASDTLKMREAANGIGRADAPHSSLAKFKRDIDYNVVNPIRLHLINNRSLKGSLELRRRKLLEFTTADKALDDCKSKRLRPGDRKYDDCKAARDLSRREFLEIDRQVFEWLYTLEEYKGDVLDSALQTLKYLQYEFFASSAHAVANVLPTRMEFRPMVEMTPQFLERQIQLSMEEEDLEESDKSSDENSSSENELRGIGGGRHGPLSNFSDRLLEKMQKDGLAPASEPAIAVDPLSLCSLMSQGKYIPEAPSSFEEASARKALRHCHNDTQAALDYLIGRQHESMGRAGQRPSSQGDIDEDDEGVPHTEVRMPTTTKRIEKLKETKRRVIEKREERKRIKDEVDRAMKERRKAKEDRDRRRRRRHRRRKAQDVEHSESRSDASGTQSSHRGKVQFSDRSRSSSSSVDVNTRRSGGSDHDRSSSSAGTERVTINDVTASADLLEMREPTLEGSSAVRRTPPTPDHHNSSAHDLLQLGDSGYNDTQKDTTSVSLVASGPCDMDSFNEEPVSFDPLAPSANSVGTGSVHTIGGSVDAAQDRSGRTPLPLLTGDEASVAVAKARQKVPEVSSSSSDESDRLS
ncbi:DnaJ sub C member 24 [Perkinsus olseni]|uniref:DnaJ sub C member 24 n=1 Tax=Perkinsus olseni TaxID=32597 RepID=A0A7J6TER2_PEROL|nr:DnaJ sub C member 24 [Perkinsus olseni]